MSELKWVFLDVGSTLVDESDVYESRCGYVISAKGLERDEFMGKVHQAAKVSPTPINRRHRLTESLCRNGTVV